MKILLALLVICGLTATISAQSCTFTIGVFGPGGDFLYQYAKLNNLFPSGVNVCFQQILNSTDQFTRLKNGDFQLVQGFMDNILARTMAVSGVREDLCVLAGGDLGPLQQLSGNKNNGILQASDLQGKDILVDSPDTGAVVVLYKMLHDLGITGNTFTQAGGAARVGRLAAGTYLGKPTYATMNFFPGTITLPPSLNNLEPAKNHFWPYQSGSYGSYCQWAKDHQSDLQKYFTGIARAYYFFKTQPTAAVTWLRTVFNTAWNQTFAQGYYDTYFADKDGPSTGFSLVPSRAALCKNIRMRQLIQSYNLGYFSTYIPVDTTVIGDAWKYVKDSNQPNKNLNGGHNDFNGPLYLKALKRAIEDVAEENDLDDEDSFWSDQYSDCKNLCDVTVGIPSSGAPDCDGEDD